MEKIKILTTQNVDLEYTPASIGDRLLAALIDYLIYFVWFLCFLFITDGAGNINLMIFVGLPIMFYHLACEIFLNGQSIGKRAMNVKVLMLDGASPAAGAYFIRWLFSLVENISFFIGVIPLITIAVNGKGQRIGDIAAGTAVVKIRPPIQLRHILPDAIPEGYQIQFSEVSQLSDRNIAIIRTVLRKGIEEHNRNMIKYTAQRVRQVMGVFTDYDDETFLQIVLNDYAAMANQETFNLS
jgi:uncharacterized RDD family membrane protein YckC